MTKFKHFFKNFKHIPRFRHWIKYIQTLTWQQGYLDLSCWMAALRSASLGIPPNVTLEVLALLISEAGDVVKEIKLRSQIERARAFVLEGHAPESTTVTARCAAHSTRAKRLHRLPAFAPDKLAAATTNVATTDPEAFIALRSPIVPQYCSSADFLAALYYPGEKVLLFTEYESQGQYLWERDRHPAQYVPLGTSDGVWYLVNPVDGLRYPNPRHNGKLSRRSQEAVTSFRFSVLESDTADASDWLKLLIQLPLRIVAVYYSGGRSVHALVRVDAASKDDWDAKIKPVKPLLTILGADPGALTAVRLSRLPQAWRGDHQQRLIYLNPGADGTPILEKPPRPLQVDWCAYVRLVLDQGQKLSPEDVTRFYEVVVHAQDDPSVAALVTRVREVARG